MAQTAHLSLSDVQTLPQGAEEELAGPARDSHIVGPTTVHERISTLDILRGIAIMGILTANIAPFAGQGLMGAALSLPRHSVGDWHAHLNLIVYFLEYTFISGKMRGLLSMLLGAGVVLMTSRIEKRGGKKEAAWIFLRRNLWMIVIGLLHSYFVWEGDFIFLYGMTSIILLFACRGLGAKTLMITGVLITLVAGTYCYLSYAHSWDTVLLAGRVKVAKAQISAGKPLTEAEKRDQQAWQKELIPLSYDKQKIDADVRKGQEGYSARLKQKPAAFFKQEMIGLKT